MSKFKVGDKVCYEGCSYEVTNVIEDFLSGFVYLAVDARGDELPFYEKELELIVD